MTLNTTNSTSLLLSQGGGGGNGTVLLNNTLVLNVDGDLFSGALWAVAGIITSFVLMFCACIVCVWLLCCRNRQGAPWSFEDEGRAPLLPRSWQQQQVVDDDVPRGVPVQRAGEGGGGAYYEKQQQQQETYYARPPAQRAYDERPPETVYYEKPQQQQNQQQQGQARMPPYNPEMRQRMAPFPIPKIPSMDASVDAFLGCARRARSMPPSSSMGM